MELLWTPTLWYATSSYLVHATLQSLSTSEFHALLYWCTLQPKPQALMANSDSASSVNWHPDSWASHHATYSAQNIHQTTPFEGPDQIYIGNGQGLPVISSGSSQFFSPLNPKFRFVLSNLLHVPHTTKNLISVSQFAKDNNVFFEFHANSCYVKSQASNETLLKRVLDKDGWSVHTPITKMAWWNGNIAK